ncbi:MULTISPECIES: hypothetical protein [unclassified Amycolatopsis]|uniref:hypothetical protein n=1 Tax=unclassified Amycolatopsis TaxID=2618356 RepID=UPI002875DE8D|nr:MULTISPECIES: hypothetical protein [unclassified Amycolatopsis]MDS0138870.1 hypothetical protein [Amycolatopsis sp. 505]MDS0147364.1 hypothetical protein [Amycolatopsis sp. CM201R]
MLAAAALGLTLLTPVADGQVGTGPWTADSPGYSEQERGCGQISGLTFQLTCSTGSGDQRAERRYTTYTGGTHQFEGSFKITSMSGSRISLKQTFRDGSNAGPYFMLAVEKGGRMYAVEGGATLGSGATVGTSVRVNTINQVGSSHKVYLNGSLKQTISSPGGSYYDKFGSYRTASGAGPITVQWSGVKFWRK